MTLQKPGNSLECNKTILDYTRVLPEIFCRRFKIDRNKKLDDFVRKLCYINPAPFCQKLSIIANSLDKIFDMVFIFIYDNIGVLNTLRKLLHLQICKI